MEVQPLSPETIQDTIPTRSTTAPVTQISASSIDSTFSKTTNLNSTALNATILSFSDEWFAPASNLLTPTPPIRRAGVYVHTGAWYDGWETRRHNEKEFDWVVIKLGVSAGVVEGVEVDTAFFSGNHAEYAALEGCYMPGAGSIEDAEVAKEGFRGWITILPPQRCGPSQRHAWGLPGENKQPYTHVRLLMYPDGGIARLRVYGSAVPPPYDEKNKDVLVELSAATNGGAAISCSDEHFGVKSNLLLPGRGKDIGDGWETARSRGKGHEDWVIVKLGFRGTIEKVVVDTKDFRGNFPRAVRVEGFPYSDGQASEPEASQEGWVDLLKGEKRCQADREHTFEVSRGEKVWSYAKLSIVPDGGVKRFRVFGRRKG